MTDLNMTELNSGIYYGTVSHSRFTPIKHSFSYAMALLAIDLDEVDKISAMGLSLIHISEPTRPY